MEEAPREERGGDGGAKRSLVRKRPVSFGVSRNFHGNVYTLSGAAGDGSSGSTTTAASKDAFADALLSLGHNEGGAGDRRMVAMVGVPPEHVPEGILSLIRSHRPFVEHVRVVISDDCRRGGDDVGEGKEENTSGGNGDRTYLVLVQLVREEDALSFVEDLDGKPYIAFDDRDKCRIERVVHLETTTTTTPVASTKTPPKRNPMFQPDYGRCTIARIPEEESKEPMATTGARSNRDAASHNASLLDRPVHSLARVANNQICAVCQEDLEPKSGGRAASRGPRLGAALLTTVCNHTFHTQCLQRYTGPCPVCRYDHSGLNETLSRCHLCGTTEHNYVCLICGAISCGVAYTAEAAPPAASSSSSTTTAPAPRFCTLSHAGQHYSQTLHAYALDTETQHVYDFCGQGYVYRLVQNKQDGKLVEVSNPRHSETNGAGPGGRRPGERSLTPGLSDNQEGEVVHRKLEGAAERYNSLLKSQLENQRAFYEERLGRMKREFSAEASNASNRAADLVSVLKQEKKQVDQRLSSLQRRKTEVAAEVAFLKSTNEGLEANKPVLKHRILQAGRERNELRDVFRKSVPELEERLEVLMKQLEEAYTTQEG